MTQRFWHPAAVARRRPFLLARMRILGALRAWFAADDFLEVTTPILQISPGAEVHLQGFATTLQTPAGTHQTRWLQTSPELTMKKLLAGGLPRLMQIAPCFRNHEYSPLHHPEFTMVEWYRAAADYRTLMDDCLALLRVAATAAGQQMLCWQNQYCDPQAAARRISVQQAFQEYAGIDLLATTPEPARPDRQLLATACRAVGVRVSEADGWEDLFFRVLGERIEPQLGVGAPCFLADYPASQAALARLKPDDPRVAERFELYVCGVELANGFSELTEPAIQRQRLLADMALKEHLYGQSWPVDEDFLAALAHGLPDCAGIALGLDRLVLLACHGQDIRDVLAAPVE